MNKFFGLAAILLLAFTACDQPTGDNSTKQPTLTIRNQSSVALTNVKFSDITFAASGSNDLPASSQSVKQLTADDVGIPYYINFTIKGIDLNCRTADAITITEDYTFTFTDQTVVEELGNSSNRKALSQIDHLPALALEYDGRSVSRSDTVNLGESVITYTKENEFIIKNTGRGKLILDGSNPVRLEGDTEAFTVLQPANSEIAANGSLAFKINFRPTEIRPYNATVTINSNASAYSFAITASGVSSKPIASVFYENIELSELDTIDAGSLLVSQSKNVSVEIRNTGTEVLTIDTANIAIGGVDADAFSVSVLPNASIQAGRTSTLVLRYTPLSEGISNATMTIPTNDDYRNPINLYLKGESVRGTAVLELSQNDTIIIANSLTPFDFGRVDLDGNKSLAFYIKNTGNINLELTGETPVTSSHLSFIVSTQPVTRTISPGDSVPFVLLYTPTEEKTDSGSITITNSGSNAALMFNVTGTGYVKRPQITIRQGNTVIVQYGEYNFGDVLINDNTEVTFTIENSGEANLTFVTGDGNCVNFEENDDGVFTIFNPPPASTVVLPGNTTTFGVRLKPTELEKFVTAVVSINTNSENFDKFSFRISGTGVNKTYAIGDTGPAGGIIFYDKGNSFDGWRYLEAAPSSTEYSSLRWGIDEVPLNISDVIGSGKRNTQIIVTEFSHWVETGYISDDYAARMCVNLVYNEYNDWFLPSIDELQLMYHNLHENGLGGFSAEGYYWSSSPFGTFNHSAMMMSFYQGFITYTTRNGYNRVRAIRAF